MDFEEISEKPFTYLMSRFFPCWWSNSEKIEDGEPEIDHDLDIDEFSDEESIVGYEKEDDFLSIVNT